MHVKRHATFTISDKGNIVRIEGMNGLFRRRFPNSRSWPHCDDCSPSGNDRFKPTIGRNKKVRELAERPSAVIWGIKTPRAEQQPFATSGPPERPAPAARMCDIDGSRQRH
jgi:hypothetical protein